MAPTRLHKLLPVILARAAPPEKQPFIIQQQSMSSNQKSLLVRSERAPISVTVAGAVLVLGAIMFSCKAIMVKLSLPYGIDPISLLALRMIFAVPAYIGILAFCLCSEQAKQQRKTGMLLRELPSVIFFGVLGYYLASYFDFVGLAYIDASLERVILYAYPTLVLLISAIWLKQKVSLHQVIAILFCYAGIFVALRLGKTNVQHENLWLGAGLVFLSALTYAAYLVGSGQLIPRLGVWTFTSCAMIVSAVCVITHFLLSAPETGLWSHPLPVYGYAFAMAIFSTVIPSFLISIGIKRIGASNAAIFGGIGPISTIVLANLLLDESLTVAQLWGTALVILGVIYISVQMKSDTSK